MSSVAGPMALPVQLALCNIVHMIILGSGYDDGIIPLLAWTHVWRTHFDGALPMIGDLMRQDPWPEVSWADPAKYRVRCTQISNQLNQI
jgi:hypothetical protein